MLVSITRNLSRNELRHVPTGCSHDLDQSADGEAANEELAPTSAVEELAPTGADEEPVSTEVQTPPAALSTDYLNRFGEALMLIEMASSDPDMIAELCSWRPVGYCEHFRTSELRCAPGALAAYDALDDTSRRAFESLCSAMSRLVETVILTLRDIDDPSASQPVIDVAAAAFHNLLGRAAAFINSGGDMHAAAYDKLALQVAIDRIIAG